MSRKHNAKHPDRSPSHYPERLAARGLTKAPVMPTLDYLRRKQGSESWLETHPHIVANLSEFRKRAVKK